MVMLPAADRDHAACPMATAAEQVINGVMLSDGGLYVSKGYVNAHFVLTQRGHSDWLLQVGRAIHALGVQTPRLYPTGIGIDYRLSSVASPILTNLWRLWYSNRVKVLPNGLLLTPITLANWFMGDGCCTKKSYYRPTVWLAVHSFSDEEVVMLMYGLSQAGFPDMGLAHNHTLSGSGMNIYLHASSSERFLNIVRPYLAPSFSCKDKMAWSPRD